MSEKTRVEEILNAIINGETIEFEPKTRLEQYLKNYINNKGVEGLPEPQTRLDALLHHIVSNQTGGGSGGGTIELGGTYTFKEDLTSIDVDWDSVVEGCNYTDGEGYLLIKGVTPNHYPNETIYISYDPNMSGSGVAVLGLGGTYGPYALYFYNAYPDVGVTSAGWYVFDNGMPTFVTSDMAAEYLTITLSSDASKVCTSSLDKLSVLFQ